jgi:galactose mutarotase-like enzyme
MAKRTWTLCDVDRDMYVEAVALSPTQVGGTARGYSVTKRTLRGGLRDGVDVIEVDNGSFRFVVIPTRGMGIWNAMSGPIRLGWKSPVKGPVHPAFVHFNEASGLGWLDGFDEFLVRCGLESNGAPDFKPDGTVRHVLHGRIANIPAHKVEVAIDGDSGELAVSGVVDEARLFGNKLRLVSTISTQVGRLGMTVSDVVTNISAEPSELELLYHVNFGAPLVGPGAKVVVPVQKIAPRDAEAVANLDEWDTYGPETPGSKEAVFFFELAADAAGQTQTLLRNASSDKGVSLKFNKNQLPCFTLWKNRQAAADGYVTGLEPSINFPNRKSFEKEKGRVAVLAPGESRSFEVRIEVHPDANSVAEAERAVAILQRGISPKIPLSPTRNGQRHRQTGRGSHETSGNLRPPG